MPTTLLLEGDDLEALLARAHAEGGPDARIVRAEKIRHGGVLGFFAKERFEVALEVPDGARPAAPPAPEDAPVSKPAPTPAPAPGAPDRVTHRPSAAAGDPGTAAREGLLGLADRADAAELSAARTLPAPRPAPDAPSPAPAPAGPDPLDEALRRLLAPEPATVASAPSPWPAPSASSASPASAGASVHPSTSRPEFTALLDQLLAPTRPADADAAVHVPAPAPAAAPARAEVPAPRTSEPAPAAVQPAPPHVPQPVPVPVPVPAPVGTAVPQAYRDASLPPAPAVVAAPGVPPAATTPPAAITPPPVPPVPPVPPAAASSPAPAPAVERHTLGRTTRPGRGTPNRDRREDPRLADDRRALRALGVPTAWTRQLRPGDRFTAVLRMLERMPEVDIDPATRVVAVVGPAASVVLEAHRTALDLPTETGAGPVPRPVVLVPAAAGAERAAALAEARLIGDVVVAVESAPLGDGQDPAQGAALAVEALQAVGAGAVIAVVGAEGGLERAQAFLDALGQVDALAVEGTVASGEPAAVLQLGLPIVRLDGIPIDRYTWTAVLCAQLGPADPQ